MAITDQSSGTTASEREREFIPRTEPESARVVERSTARPLIVFSCHARHRAARRNVVPNAIEYVLAHGRAIQRTGLTFYFLGWRDIPSADRRASWASRLEGTTVLIAENGEIVTLYRDRRALRAIRRKAKYRLCPSFGRPARGRKSEEQASPLAG